jgi:hypothetical protein
MQQTSINFEGYALNPSASSEKITLKERIQSAKSSVNNWLDTKSVFYSRIAEFEVTRRAAIRIGIVLPLAMGMTVACVEQAPLVSIAAMCVSGWIVYRMNQGEKGGER